MKIYKIILLILLTATSNLFSDTDISGLTNFDTLAQIKGMYSSGLNTDILMEKTGGVWRIAYLLFIMCTISISLQVYKSFATDEDITLTGGLILFFGQFVWYLLVIIIFTWRINPNEMKLDEIITTEQDIRNGKEEPDPGLINEAIKIKDRATDENFQGPPLVLASVNSYFNILQKYLIERLDHSFLKSPDSLSVLMKIKENAAINDSEFGRAINDYVTKCFVPTIERHKLNFDDYIINGEPQLLDDDLIDYMANAYLFVGKKSNTPIYTYRRLGPSGTSSQLKAYMDNYTYDPPTNYFKSIMLPGSHKWIGSDPTPPKYTCYEAAESLLKYAEALVYTKDNSISRAFIWASGSVTEKDLKVIDASKAGDSLIDKASAAFSDLTAWEDTNQARKWYLSTVVNKTYVLDNVDYHENILWSGLKSETRGIFKDGHKAYNSVKGALASYAYGTKAKVLYGTYSQTWMWGYFILIFFLAWPGKALLKITLYFTGLFTIKMMPVIEALLSKMLIMVATNEAMKQGKSFKPDAAGNELFSAAMTSLGNIDPNVAEAYMDLYQYIPLISISIVTFSFVGMAGAFAATRGSAALSAGTMAANRIVGRFLG